MKSIFSILCLFASIAFGGETVTIDPAVKYNTNDGWETTTVWADIDPNGYYMDTLESFRDELADIAVNELGLNRVRLELRSGSENSVDNFSLYLSREITYNTSKERWYHKENDNGRAKVADPDGFHFSELDYQMENVILPMKRKLEERGEEIYINLQLVDLNDAEQDRDGDGKHPKSDVFYDDRPSEYAELIHEAFKHLDAKYGFIPDSLEVILEPDNGSSFWSAWDGATGVDIADCMVAAVDRLEADGYVLKDVIAPSVVYAGNADKYFDEMITVRNALEKITTISYHTYDRKLDISERADILDRAKQHGLKTAMLEYTEGDGKHWFFEALNTHISSYQRWGYAAVHPSTYIETDFTVPDAPVFGLHDLSKGLVHVFPYIRPGAVQIAASGNSVAYINPNGGYTVIISNDQGDYGSFAVNGLPAGTYEVVSYGRDSRNMDSYGVTYPDIKISAGETLTLPSVKTSRGLITIFSKGSKVVPDTLAPSVPVNLDASISASSDIMLSWDASSDNVGVFRYRIFRNGIEIGVSEDTRYTDSGITSGAYSYEVSAYDAALRESGRSDVARVVLGASSDGVYNDMTYTDYGTYIEITGAVNVLEGDVYIPDSIRGVPVTAVAANAFSGQSELTGVILSAHAVSIGNSAFQGDAKLDKVFFKGNAPDSMASNAFVGVSGGLTVYFFGGATGFNDVPWTSYATADLGDYSPLKPWLLRNGYASETDVSSDQNGDGVPLLIEYALRLDPKISNGGNVPLPVVNSNSIDYTYYSLANGITYTAEVSRALNEWSTQGISMTGPNSTGYSTASVPRTGDPCFFRLIVSQ